MMEPVELSRVAHKKADKRRRILDAALGLFAERGFHGTAVPLVAGRAEVGAGTIYRFFESKEEIALALPAPRSNGEAVSAAGTGTLTQRLESFEREVLLAELRRNHHHMTNTARALGLERSHLYKKCQQLGIDLQSERKAE